MSDTTLRGRRLASFDNTPVDADTIELFGKDYPIVNLVYASDVDQVRINRLGERMTQLEKKMFDASRDARKDDELVRQCREARIEFCFNVLTGCDRSVIERLEDAPLRLLTRDLLMYSAEESKRVKGRRERGGDDESAEGEATSRETA